MGTPQSLPPIFSAIENMEMYEFAIELKFPEAVIQIYMSTFLCLQNLNSSKFYSVIMKSLILRIKLGGNFKEYLTKSSVTNWQLVGETFQLFLIFLLHLLFLWVKSWSGYGWPKPLYIELTRYSQLGIIVLLIHPLSDFDNSWQRWKIPWEYF